MSEHPFTFEQEKNLLKSRKKSEYSSNRVNRIARHWLFKLLAHAKSGHLIFKENNHRVAEFGNPDSFLPVIYRPWIAGKNALAGCSNLSA